MHVKIISLIISDVPSYSYVLDYFIKLNYRSLTDQQSILTEPYPQDTQQSKY